MLTITHTAADGTLLEGSTKGDGAWEAIKAAQQTYKIRGWRYMPSIRMVGVSHSRDRAPLLGLIDRTADVLRDAGFDVEIEIDGAPRAMEEAEADRAARMDDRAEALAGKAERKADEADSRYAAAQAIGEHIPMGQPVLVGHHSERGHRRDIKRMDGHMRKSVEAAAEAKLAAARAQSAERHMEARNNPRRVYRRIKTLKADLGRAQRELDGYTTRHLDGHGQPVYVFEHQAAEGRRREEVEGRVADLTEKIRYWTEALDAAKEAGADVPPDTDAIKKGYWVKSWAGWKEVKRVNKVSVTVIDSWDNPNDPEPRYFDRKVTLDDIREIRERSPFEPTPAVDLDAELAALDAADAVTAAEPTPEPAPAVEPARHPSGLSEAALDVLRAAGATERSIHLVGVPDDRAAYAEVHYWLTSRPGFQTYSTGERAYLYRQDPRQTLAEVTGWEPVRPASGEHDKRLAYFATPDITASLMATEIGAIGTGRVLEPSAGDGALVRAVLRQHPAAEVTAVEVDDARVRLLYRQFRMPGVDGHVYSERFQDFALQAFEDSSFVPFDAVVMNPPFTEPGDPRAWSTHFGLAWDLLAPGGRMVAILPNSYRFSELRAAREVRELVEGSGGMVVDLPESTFAGVGTNVRTVLVCTTKGSE
jgi:16S rRNA C967 or C1407 C5-methylase (RsmB/RsmF family)